MSVVTKEDQQEALTEALERLKEQNALASPEQMAQYYSEQWASEYENHLKLLRENEPYNFSQFVRKHITNKELLILDLGAGTGMLGEILHSAGYLNVEAHDGAEGMLTIAKQKGCYKEFYVELLFEDQISKILPHRRYDAVVTFDAFSKPELLNEKHLLTVMNLVKPGGLLLLGGSVKLFDEEFESKCKQLEENICRMIDRQISHNYLMLEKDNEGKPTYRDAIYLAFEVN